MTWSKVGDNATAVNSVLELAKGIGVNIGPENINDAYFLRKTGTSDKKRVAVKFSNKQSKDKLMSLKPKLKENKNLSAAFVNDFLTKETLDLLNYVTALKNVGYSFVFARSGRIFYMKSETSRAQVVRCEEDLDKLILSATNSQT